MATYKSVQRHTDGSDYVYIIAEPTEMTTYTVLLSYKHGIEPVQSQRFQVLRKGGLTFKCRTSVTRTGTFPRRGHSGKTGKSRCLLSESFTLHFAPISESLTAPMLATQGGPQQGPLLLSLLLGFVDVLGFVLF